MAIFAGAVLGVCLTPDLGAVEAYGLTIFFDGQLYDQIALHQQLNQKGYALAPSQDAAIVLAAYHAYGAACLDRLEGKFAFAIWDKEKQTLFCARDRFGEKQFYFELDDNPKRIRFSNDIGHLLTTGTDSTVDETFLYYYLSLGYTQLPHKPWQTFYQDISQLPPAHVLHYDARTDNWHVEVYWDLDKETCVDQPDAVDRFKQAFLRSVDSCSNTAAQLGTIENDRIENQALEMALQKPHLILNNFLSVANIQEVIFYHRQPIASPKVIAEYLIFLEAAEQGIDVLLIDQGANESLAGHRSYVKWYLNELIHTVGWKEASRQAAAFKEDTWGWRRYIAAHLPALQAMRAISKRVDAQQNCTWIDPEFAASARDRSALQRPIVEKLNDIQYIDLMITGLPESIQATERNAIRLGLDIRRPYLDPALVQSVLSLPASYRMQNGMRHWLLRESFPALRSYADQDNQQVDLAWMEDAQIKEKTTQAMDHLTGLGIIRPVKKELTTTERFRILVAGYLLAERE